MEFNIKKHKIHIEIIVLLKKKYSFNFLKLSLEIKQI